MKKIIVKSLLFCLMPLPFLFLLSYIVDHGLRKSRYSYYSEWNDLFDGKINADLLIIGTSRAWVHFSPRIIDSMLHVNSYNLAMDGADFDFGYRRLKIYLKYNKKPKYIVQEIGLVKTLLRSDKLPETIQFLPYLYDTSVWQIVKNDKKNFSYFDRYFPLYKYNNEFAVMREGVRSYFGKGAKSAKYKGFEGKSIPWDSSFYDFKQSNPDGWTPTYTKEGVDEFKDYLDFCKANGIKVIFVYPPVFHEATEMLTPKRKAEIMGIYNNFSAEYNFPFYNYEKDTLCNYRYYFYNSQHLNKTGAEIFSKEFANDIKKEISL